MQGNLYIYLQFLQNIWSHWEDQEDQKKDVQHEENHASNGRPSNILLGCLCPYVVTTSSKSKCMSLWTLTGAAVHSSAPQTSCCGGLTWQIPGPIFFSFSSSSSFFFFFFFFGRHGGRASPRPPPPLIRYCINPVFFLQAFHWMPSKRSAGRRRIWPVAKLNVSENICGKRSLLLCHCGRGYRPSGRHLVDRSWMIFLLSRVDQASPSPRPSKILNLRQRWGTSMKTISGSSKHVAVSAET